MKLSNGSFHSFSAEQTISWAADFAAGLKPNDLVLLTGDLGAGKTTFAQGLARGLGSEDLVQSPTYVYLQIYEASIPLFHFDLYRLVSSDDFLAMGFEEFFHKKGICLIEWPERIRPILPPDAIRIEIRSLSENERMIHVS